MDHREAPRPPGESSEKNNTAMVKQTTTLPPAFQPGPQGPPSPRFPTNNELGGARLNSPQTQQQQHQSLRRSDSRSSLQVSQPPLGPGSLQAGRPVALRPQRFFQRSPQPQFYPGPNQNYPNLQPGTPKRFPLTPNQGLRGSLTTRPRSLVTSLQAPRPQSSFPPNSFPYNNGIRSQQNYQQDFEQGSTSQTNVRSDLTGESRPETPCSRRPPMNNSQPQLVSGQEALPLPSNQETAPQGNELLMSDGAESAARDQKICSRSLSSEKMVAGTEQISEAVTNVKTDDRNLILALDNSEDTAEMVKLSTDDDNDSSMRFDKVKNNRETCPKPNNELRTGSEDDGLYSSQIKIFQPPNSESPQSLQFENSQPSKLEGSQPLRASKIAFSSDAQRTEYGSLISSPDENVSFETLGMLRELEMDERMPAIGLQSSVSASAVSAPRSPKFSAPLANPPTPSSASLQSDFATIPDFLTRSPVFVSPMTPRPGNMEKSRAFTPQLSNLPKSPGCLKSFETEKSGKSSPDTEGSKKRATFAKDLIIAGTKEDISAPSTPSDLKVSDSTTADESSKGMPMTSPKGVRGTPKKPSPPSFTDRAKHQSRSPKTEVRKSLEKGSEAKQSRSARESKEQARIWENRSKKPEGDDSGVDESTQGNEPTTNGDAGSPTKSHSKIPGPKRSTSSSPTKSPSKSAKSLPKTPENSLSTSASGDTKKKVPMNKIQVGAAPSPNLKTVRSKIGSLENTSYKPGGGKIKIENRKLDFSKAQPKIAAKNDKYTPSGGDKKITQVKLQWNAKPKVGSLENATYKPGGGDKKIETVKLDFKEKAKPKIASKENVKHVPGGGTVKIETVKLEVKAESKVGSLDNVKHKPGGGDKKIFNDKDYLRQTSSNVDSLSGSGSQSPVRTSAINEGRNGLPTSDENLNQEC